MKYKILQTFRVSGESQIAGNTFESDSCDWATPARLKKWLAMEWIVAVV